MEEELPNDDEEGEEGGMGRRVLATCGSCDARLSDDPTRAVVGRIVRKEREVQQQEEDTPVGLVVAALEIPSSPVLPSMGQSSLF